MNSPDKRCGFVPLHILKSEGLASSVNIVSQQPATNLVFVRALGRVFTPAYGFSFSEKRNARSKGIKMTSTGVFVEAQII